MILGIFDQYGIKEVADVTIYSIHKKKDGSGDVYYVPALYLDTLKISSTEKTAENVWAQGGLGNARLICWDYGKQINVTLEDALCTPASLGLCWGGVLSSDWKDGHVNHDMGITFNDKHTVERLSRMEKAFYPRGDRKNISYLLPHMKDDNLLNDEGNEKTILSKSSIIDGTEVNGFGYVNNRTYKWRLAIESNIKSISQIPNKFFDIYGKSYKIADKQTITVKSPSSSKDDFKYEICYKINPAEGLTLEKPKAAIIIDKSDAAAVVTSDDYTTLESLKTASYLKIRVTNDDRYLAYLGKTALMDTSAGKENKYINVEQFKGLDMWLRFSSINELIYFILTKYENDILYIKSASYKPKDNESSDNPGAEWSVSLDESEEAKQKEGKLWAYVNPKTMTPYEDDYWFNQGEPYYIKSLTIASEKKKLKSQRITVTAGQFPGMYMIVGETYIRSRDTGEDERMQLKFPLCKIKSDQTLTLEAEGDPTTFNLDVEVAKPTSGVMMELTSYEVATKMESTPEGYYVEKDGSTEVLSE